MARKLEELETKRLLLRGINESDAAVIVQWRSVPEVYQFFKSPHQITLEEHLSWYQTRYLSNEDRCDWIGIEKAHRQPIGVFGLSREKETAEVNYLLSPAAQHKGYASEAIRALIRYAAKNWKSRRVVAEIHKDNLPSVLFAKRLGFTPVSKTDPFWLYEITERSAPSYFTQA